MKGHGLVDLANLLGHSICMAALAFPHVSQENLRSQVGWGNPDLIQPKTAMRQGKKLLGTPRAKPGCTGSPITQTVLSEAVPSGYSLKYLARLEHERFTHEGLVGGLVGI